MKQQKIPAQTLTTQEVARLLHVSEATVKRWADDGVIQSVKTAGGHRRFSIQTVAQLRREKGMLAVASAPGHSVEKTSSRPALSPGDFRELLLRGHEDEVAAVLVDSYLSQVPLASLFDSMVSGAMREIGEGWLSGEITIADEHLATRVMLNALQKLRAVIIPADATGLKGICCAIEGDLHELPVHLAEIILESEGWDAVNLGPNTPLFTLRDMVAHQRPQLVCVSGRLVVDLDRAATEYEQLRKLTARIRAAVVLGGEGFRDPKLRERFPSDIYVDSFAGLAQFARALAKTKSEEAIRKLKS